MTGGAHEALEHAEHTHHAAHSGSNFTTVVAMVMAMIAALLAVVTLLSHRAHNDTIVFQAESSKKTTEASDQWAFYQAKKIRRSEYEAYLELLPVLAKEDDPHAAKARAKWEQAIAKYDSDAPNELKDIAAKATALKDEAVRNEGLSHEAHAKGDRYDAGELLVEIALVLCSIAMLAKRKSFLGVAIVLALVGAGVAGTGYFGVLMGAHGEHEEHAAAAVEKPHH